MYTRLELTVPSVTEEAEILHPPFFLIPVWNFITPLFFPINQGRTNFSIPRQLHGVFGTSLTIPLRK